MTHPAKVDIFVNVRTMAPITRLIKGAGHAISLGMGVAGPNNLMRYRNGLFNLEMELDLI